MSILTERQFQTVMPCNSSHHSMDTQAYSYPFRRHHHRVSWDRANERDFATDFDARQIPFETKLHFTGWGKVHEGWVDGVNVVLSKIAEALKAHDDGVRPLWITGYSLGGALAIVTAAFLASVPHNRIAGVFTHRYS